MMAIRLDVAGRDVGNRLLAKRHRRLCSRKNERANELQSRVVVARPNELIPASRTPVVLTPRPRVNLILYHGVLAPRAAWRAALVPKASHDVDASPMEPSVERDED